MEQRLAGEVLAVESDSADLAAQQERDVPLSVLDLQVVRILGNGSYGIVRMVRDTSTGELYALKSMKTADVREMELELAIIGEKEALCHLRHPNIIRLFRTFSTPTTIYMLMEIARGGELNCRIQRPADSFKFKSSRGASRGGLSMDHARYYAACTASALFYMLRKRYVHRDLKPENAMIDDKGVLKLIDFGFARQIVKGRAFTICGTQLYMSPEMLLGAGYTFSTDWWSFGVFLFELVHGYNPFEDAKSTEELIRRIISARFRFPVRKGGMEGSQANDLISNLMRSDADTRMSFVSNAIKEHAWFSSVNWSRVQMNSVKPCWKPDLSGDVDVMSRDDASDIDSVPFSKGSWTEALAISNSRKSASSEEWIQEWESIAPHTTV